MKKQIFIAAAFVAATCITGQLYAQAGEASKTAGYDLKKAVKCRVSSTETGCDIVFESDVKSPRDVATGQASGKRQHKPYSFAVSSSDNSVSEIKSPRDLATGQSSGKRTAGNPIGGLSVKGGKGNNACMSFQKIIIENNEFTIPGGCPDGSYEMTVSWSWGASNSGSSKRCSVDFLLEIEDGVCHAINTKGTGATNK
ncbi:MAG: hypothetical protein RIS73_1324 [Bacteroidota bacterium]|jgi:hypothetical protein